MEEIIKRYNLFFVVLIVAVGVFFRFYDLKAIPPGLYYDEAMNGNNALEIIESPGSLWKNFKVFYPENNGREGLFINIQAVAVNFLGNDAWVLRLVSAIFGSLTILGLYLLTKELFKKNFSPIKTEVISLLASFFLATSFWHINFSRIGFRAIMAPFFLVWSTWLVWMLIQKRDDFSKLKTSFFALIAGFIFGLGFYSYISYRVAPLILLIPLFIFIKDKKFLPILFFTIAFVITIYPLVSYFYKHPQDFFGRTSEISIFSAQPPITGPLINLLKNIFLTFIMFFAVGDFNWRHNIAGAPQLWWPLGIFFLIGIIYTLKEVVKDLKLKRLNYEYCFLFFWFFSMMLPVVISNEGIPHALRSIPLVPVAMIFSAIGFYLLMEKIKIWIEKQKEKNPEYINQLNRINKELLVLALVFLIVLGINAYKQYFLDWAAKVEVAYAFNKDETDLGRYLKYLPSLTKKYVILNNEDNPQIFPMQVLPIMFLTDTYLPEKQKEKNIYYVLPKDIDKMIKEANEENSLQIFMLKNDPPLRKRLTNSIPGLFTYYDKDILIQAK